MYNTPQEILNAIAYTSQYLKELFPLDCMVSVTDREKFIAYYSGNKIDIGLKSNCPIPEGEIILEVIKSGHKIVAEVPKEIYGYPFKGIVMPIKDNSGMVIGTFNIGVDLTTQSELMEITEQLAASFEEVSGSTEELAASAQELNSSQKELLEISKKTQEYIKNTDEILNLINDVASQTRLLGLNAAIEAARAGELGKGFTVVASEIRKLSSRTSQSTREVVEILKKINEYIGQISIHIDKNKEISDTQAAVSQEISTTIQEYTVMTEKLVNFAKLL